MTKSREELIDFIATEWVDNIDIRAYFKACFIEYSELLETWTDEQLEKEYALMIDD